MISLNNSINDHIFKLHNILIFVKQIRAASKFKAYDPREKALKHFDDFYKVLFSDRWPSVRLGLLSKQKYVAVLNNFADIEKTKKFLERKGAFDLVNFLQVQKTHAGKSDVESSTQTSGKVPVQEIIQELAHQEERKELSQFHPEGEEFKSEIDILSEETEKKEGRDILYNPTEARTSLHEDLLSSQVDTSRLIEPDSYMSQAKLHDFIPATLLRGLEDYIPESEYYKYYQVQTDTPITVEKEDNFEFPEKLKVYIFDRGDISEFPEPFKDHHNVYNYMRVEGSDLLTALMLDVQPEDRVLDLYSTSSSMAYCIFQTLRPKVLVCATSGKGDTENTFRSHLYDYEPFWREILLITNKQWMEFKSEELFDKVLINVPSTEDKRSALEIENNAFRDQIVRERLRLPQYQCDLLLKALNLVRPGGTVVYSTSTLSPIQNEAIIMAALKTAWQENKMKFTVKNLSPALKHISYFYNLQGGLNTKYGTLVVPFAPINFGPKYFCKLVKMGAQK